MKKEDKQEIFKALGTFGNIGFTLASSTIVGLFLGRWIDRFLNTSPWVTVIGIVLGMVVGMWSMYKQIINRQ